jgi:hypothetical protein
VTPHNPDKVSGPVVGASALGLVLAAAIRSIIDRYVDPADRDMWWNIAQVALFLLPVIGAWLGGLRAKGQVTPVTPDATPRDLDGNELAPVSHRPSTGYPPPERLARPEERPRRNRVDPP